MAIGDRIHFIRTVRGMTQTQLGMAVGFSKTTAKVRISQYESGARIPKGKLKESLAAALGVSPEALDPDIDSDVGVMHTLFALEDMYGLKIKNVNGEICLLLDNPDRTNFSSLYSRFFTWLQEAEKLTNGEITREEYNYWRYNYPRIEAERFKIKIDEYLTRNKK